MIKIKRVELLTKCKELGIVGASSKNKSELILLIKNNGDNKESINIKTKENKLFQKVLNELIVKIPKYGIETELFQKVLNELLVKIPKDKCRKESKLFQKVLNELIVEIPKDKSRKVCKNCNELNHNSASKECKLNIIQNVKLTLKIKTQILEHDALDEITLEEKLNTIAAELEITNNACKTLYTAIDPIELIDIKMDIKKYITSLKENSMVCYECNKYVFNSNTLHSRKGNKLCDTCWGQYDKERDILWELIKKYKKIECVFCNNKKLCKERYHLDHINMFSKENSICNMVADENDINDIYKEIDKCQYVCIICHSIITNIENKLQFTRIKNIQTRSLNNNLITKDEYEQQNEYYQKLYAQKMNVIYDILKLELNKKY
jgi:DNA-directed RNA polymerase subunit RPC12/RpoP